MNVKPGSLSETAFRRSIGTRTSTLDPIRLLTLALLLIIILRVYVRGSAPNLAMGNKYVGAMFDALAGILYSSCVEGWGHPSFGTERSRAMQPATAGWGHPSFRDRGTTGLQLATVQYNSL